MYQKSSNYICSAVSNIRSRNIKKGYQDVSIAEAYLPLKDSEKNSVVSRYVTVFSFLDEDTYEYDEEAVETIADIGEELATEITNQDFYPQKLERDIREAEKLFDLDSNAQKASEDSAWGQMVIDILEEQK